MSTIMQYGDYDFVPAPFMRLGRTPSKSGDGRIISLGWNATLNGTLVAYPSSSIVTIDALQDELAAAVDQQGKLFHLECNGTTLLDCYPRIGELSFEDGIWVDTCKYSLQMEWDALPSGSGISQYISEFSEDWNFEAVDDRGRFTYNTGAYAEIGPNEYRLTHTVNVTGKTTYTDGVENKLAWEEARDFIIEQNILGLNLAAASDKLDGIYGINPAAITGHKHTRTVSINERAGSYSVTEGWILLDGDRSPSGMATEDFTVNIRQGIDSPLVNVSIEGNIQGLETTNYAGTGSYASVTQTRYEAAKNYWNNIKTTNLYNRCNYGYQTYKNSTARSLNPTVLNLSYGENPKSGVITYNYEYNDRALNCFSGSRLETFSISDDNPVDVVAIIQIAGKTGGPLFQNVGTQTEGTRTLNIEAVFDGNMICPTGASTVAIMRKPPDSVLTEVATVKSAFEADLTNDGYSWFVAQNSQSWTPQDGRFSRTIAWKYSRCDV